MDDFKSKTLGFVYHVPFWEENGEVWTTFSPIGRYVEALASHFRQVTLIAPTKTLEQEPLYHVTANNITIIYINSLKNVQSYYSRLFHFYINCLRFGKQVDIINIRMPTLTGFPAFVAAKIQRKPVFLVVVGENLEFIKLAGYSGIKRIAAQFVGWFQDHLMRIMIKSCPTFTNGEDLLNKYNHLNQNVHLMRSSTVNQADILSEFRDTCQSMPYQILTVAVVSPRKGIILIPQIIALLRDSGVQVNWKIIGSIEGHSGELELNKTKQLANELGVASALSFERPIGFSDLLPRYQASDIFVLPTYMEGIPRVILEAQASGLPVITTNVGGIPGAVRDGVNALLCPPGGVLEITEAIRKIILDEALRQSMIKNGLITAHRNTLEQETKRMLSKIGIINHGNNNE